MMLVRLAAPGSIAFATLLTTLAPPATLAAAGQAGPPTPLEAFRASDCVDATPSLGDDTTPREGMRADECDSGNRGQSTPAGETAPLRPGPRGRPFVAVLAAIPLITYAGATGPRSSEVLTPGDRFATSQLLGAGYVVNPRFRFGAMGIFNEVLTGLPPTADAWQFGGIAPIAIGTFDHFIIGGGPIIGYRSGGKRQSDVGLVVLSGASIPLKKGLALNVAAPTTALFMRRYTVSVGVAVGVAKVF